MNNWPILLLLFTDYGDLCEVIYLPRDIDKGVFPWRNQHSTEQQVHIYYYVDYRYIRSIYHPINLFSGSYLTYTLSTQHVHIWIHMNIWETGVYCYVVMMMTKLIPDNLIHVYNDGFQRYMFRETYGKLNIEYWTTQWTNWWHVSTLTLVEYLNKAIFKLTSLFRSVIKTSLRYALCS